MPITVASGISSFEKQKGGATINGILMKPDIWIAKKKVLEQYGEAQTRRLSGLKKINKEPDVWEFVPWKFYRTADLTKMLLFRHKETGEENPIKPRYHPGEVVYIKEAYALNWLFDAMTPKQVEDTHIATAAIWYKYNDTQIDNGETQGRWRSPMMMPEWASRYHIQITDIRPERLQKIKSSDCVAEGVASISEINMYVVCIGKYFRLWNEINPNNKADSNPWVWVYTFKGAPKE